MLKATLVMGVLLAPFALFPAQAMECSEASLMKMKVSVDKMAPSNGKDMAMKEMVMAKDDMDKKNENDCMMHMQKAEDNMLSK